MAAPEAPSSDQLTCCIGISNSFRMAKIDAKLV
jgi:hypothetical protein